MAEKRRGIMEALRPENLKIAFEAIKQILKGGSPTSPPKWSPEKLKKIKGALKK